LTLRRTYPYLALVVVVCTVYLPLFAGQVLYQRDVTRWLYPARDFLHQSYARGDSPLWNPFVGLGLSTLANPLNEVFYPPNAGLFLVHSPRVTSFFLLFHLLLGGVGMLVLVRQLVKAPTPAALIAGLMWCLSGYTTSEVIAGALMIAGAYLPWTAVGLVYLGRLVREEAPFRRRLGGIAWAALPLGLCFATGEVFMPILAGMFALCVTLGDAWAGSRDASVPEPGEQIHPLAWRTWLVRFGVALGLTVFIAGLLGSATLVPAQRAANRSERLAAFPRQVAEVGSFHPWRLAEMVAQGAMGDPYTNYPAGPFVGEPGLGDRPLLYDTYAGSVGLALALLAFGRRRRLTVVLGSVAVFFLFVAFGRHTWLHAAFRTAIPPLAFMRGPEKYLAIVTAALALLGGLGSARILTEKQPPWLRTLAVPAVLAALAIAAPSFPHAMAASVRSAALTSFAFAIALVALVWYIRRSVRAVGPLLVLLVLVDLSRSVFALQNFVAPEQLGGEPEAARVVRADAKARGLLAPPRVYRSPSVDRAIELTTPPRSVAHVQHNLVNTLIDNHSGCFGIASVPGYDAAVPAALAALWRDGLRSGLDLLRLTGTEYVMLPKATPPSPGLDGLMDPAPGVRLFHVAGALPRVYLARPSAPMSDAEARVAVFSPKVLAGDEAIPAANPGAVPNLMAAFADASPPGQCRLRGFAQTRIEADCDARTSALAVFVEQYDAGWSATVDGQPAQLLRANLVMRAVPIPEGRHRILLQFSPTGLGLGVALSMVGLLTLFIFILLGRRAPELRRRSGVARGCA
jgi:hypothetical protein